MIRKLIMPTVHKPKLVHILCDDLQYEKDMFQHLDHEQSCILQLNSRSRIHHLLTSSNTNTHPSNVNVTEYAYLRLLILGKYKTVYDNTTVTLLFPKLPPTLRPNDYKSFCSHGYSQSFVNTLMISQTVTNGVTAELLKLIHEEKIQSVFVHLKSPASQNLPSPRTQAIINFVIHNQLSFFEESP